MKCRGKLNRASCRCLLPVIAAVAVACGDNADRNHFAAGDTAISPDEEHPPGAAGESGAGRLSDESPYDATITVDGSIPLAGEVSRAVYGGFIEFLGQVINGPAGLWAEEIRNRGFDLPDTDSDGVSGEGAMGWQRLASSSPDAGWMLRPGGQNLRGVYAQGVMQPTGNGEAGVSQLVLFSPGSLLDFSVYARGDSASGELNVRLSSRSGTIVYSEASLGAVPGDWTRYEAALSAPSDPEIHAGLLEIAFSGNGTFWIDEASLMPADNVGGVRREYFELYRCWGLGALRYPGGSMADGNANHWLNGVGPMDQRASPNRDEFWEAYQRLDFGTDEYLALCEAAGIEPHITVNFGTGTPEEAASWVEYCNGSAATAYGRLRAENGHPEPYGVRYWEIGNEQWLPVSIGHTAPEEYGERFVEFYRAMKAVDPTIRIIANGHFQEQWSAPMIATVGEEIDLLSMHFFPSYIDEGMEQEAGYLLMMSTPALAERFIETCWARVQDIGLAPRMRLSISEWWQSSAGARTNDLAAGLWTALLLNVFQRHPDAVETACRTTFSAIETRIDRDTGERWIFTTPIYHVLRMYSLHSGPAPLSVDVEVASYSPPDPEGNGMPGDVPYLDVSATRSDSAVFLAVVNRHPGRSFVTRIQWNGLRAGSTGTVYELTSDSFTDLPDPVTGASIAETETAWERQDAYEFPRNSVTIIELPLTP